MPFYTVHCNMNSYKKREWFGEKLAHLHAETFGTDWRAVRVEYLVYHPADTTIQRYGGHNFKETKGFFTGDRIASDYIVAHVNFTGSSVDWQEYCRKVAKLYEEPNLSIYLQKLEMEFEFGSLIPAVSAEKETGPFEPSSSTSAPPAYGEQMKER